MNGYYIEFLKNSSYYINLVQAEKDIGDILDSIVQLQIVIESSSGNNIDIIEKNLADLLVKTNKYSSMIHKAIMKLESNANQFDKIFEEWKGKIGSNFKEPVVCKLNGASKYLNQPMYYEKITKVEINARKHISVFVSKYRVGDTFDPNNGGRTTIRENCGASVWEYQFNTETLIECTSS